MSIFEILYPYWYKNKFMTCQLPLKIGKLCLLFVCIPRGNPCSAFHMKKTLKKLFEIVLLIQYSLLCINITVLTHWWGWMGTGYIVLIYAISLFVNKRNLNSELHKNSLFYLAKQYGDGAIWYNRKIKELRIKGPGFKSKIFH